MPSRARFPMAAQPSSEGIDERQIAAFRERSRGIRENAQRVAIALEVFRQEIENGLTRAGAVGAWHSEPRTHSVADEKDLQLERARAILQYCAKVRSRIEANLVIARRLLGELS